MEGAVDIAGCDAVAALVPPRGSSPFDRGDVVVRHPGGSLLRVRQLDGTMALGDPVDEADLESLVASEQAIRLRTTSPGAVPVRGLAAWVLRGPLLQLGRDLAASPHHLFGPHPLPGGGECHLVDDVSLGPLRDGWSRDHAEAARACALAGDWDEMYENARCAHALARGLDPEVLALLVLACERTGREVRARGLARMALNSGGEVLAARLADARARLDRELGAPRADVWWLRSDAVLDLRCGCGAAGLARCDHQTHVRCGACGATYRLLARVEVSRAEPAEVASAERCGAVAIAVVDKRSMA